MRRLVFFFALALTACTRLDARVVKVNGQRIEVATAGSGGATVVFESGLGSDWAVWDEAAALVSRSNRVFAYSRPGYGRSDAPTTPRDAATIVEELRALLADQSVAPPFVLVGHSFGGAYMELFARTWPQEVSGLVLVDSRHVDFTTECEARNLGGCSITAEMAKSMPRVQQDELAAFAQSSSAMRAAGGFGPYPVRVLTATKHGESEAFEQLWQSLQASLAAEAADGEQLVFRGAGHNLEYDRPRDVARVIEQLAAR